MSLYVDVGPLKRGRHPSELKPRTRRLAAVAALALATTLALPSTGTPQDQQEDSIAVIERGTPGADGWDIAELPFKVVFFPLYLVSLGFEWAGGAVNDALPKLTRFSASLHDRGFYPTVAAQGSNSGIGTALTIGVPPTRSNAWGHVRGGGTLKEYWLAEARLGYGPVFGWTGVDERFGINALGSRRHRPEDEFFGLGNESREEDRSNYLLDVRQITGELVVIPVPGNLEFVGTGGYENMQSGAGRRSSLQSVDKPGLFTQDELPGFGEEREYLVLGAAANGRIGYRHAIQRGGYWGTVGYRWHSSRTDGAADFGHLTGGAGIEVPFDHHIRSLNLALYYESVRPSGGGDIAFHRLPTLGGSSSLPAYRSGRFRDRESVLGRAEYRYRLWDDPRGSAGVDAVLFTYGGMVASSMSQEFRFNRLRPAYGVALALLSLERRLVYWSFAWGDEGFRTHFNFGLRQ